MPEKVSAANWALLTSDGASHIPLFDKDTLKDPKTSCYLEMVSRGQRYCSFINPNINPDPLAFLWVLAGFLSVLNERFIIRTVTGSFREK